MNTTQTKPYRRSVAQYDKDKAILIALLDGGMCPKEIADKMEIGAQAVYHQARALGYRALLVRKEMLKNPAAMP